jgi:hypothetical protein
MTWTPEERLKLIAEASNKAMDEVRAGQLRDALDRLDAIRLLATCGERFLDDNAEQIKEFVSRPASTERR